MTAQGWTGKPAPYNQGAEKLRMPTLIVTLPDGLPTATSICSTVLTDDARTVTEHATTALSLLPDPAGGEIVAVVPVSQLSWHRLDLPKGTLDRGLFQDGSPTRLRAVLEGLIEDRLLDEPEQLHFSIEPEARPGAPVWVLVCGRAWLNGWLQALEQVGRPVARIVPESEPLLPDSGKPAALCFTGTPDDPWVIWSALTGVNVLPASAETVSVIASAVGASASVEVTSEPAVATLAERFFPGSVVLQTGPQRAVAAAQSQWDLAQFDLLRSRRARVRKRMSSWTDSLLRAAQWRPARWAAAVLIVVNLLGLQAWSWKEQALLNAKRAAVRDILIATFPDIRVVVDAPLQMTRSLADLQRQSGVASGADMESMLGRFQALAPEIPAPAAIEFVAGELRLKFPAAPAADWANVNARFQTFGYSVQLRGDNLVVKQEKSL